MDLVIRGRSQDQRGARPWDTGRTRVEPDRTRVEPGRTGPQGMEGKAEGAQESRQQQSAGVHQREPKAQGRVAAQSGRLEAVPEQASQ